ncbi:hypothetical protein CJ030_MR0G004676 [Morella rubra]|uniref:Uncharacterized protein n=1 Tax=Morella rubra TaxID=262757 RepID=A0A6A1ULB6_9ROSI|nr:hypothetical protein CJ030_MR0G004676 [Morella rubra]
MWQKQPNKSCFRESIKALEADIQHANTLFLVCGPPFHPFSRVGLDVFPPHVRGRVGSPTLLEKLVNVLLIRLWYMLMGCQRCPQRERKATLREFYAVIYPSLRQLEGEFIELEGNALRSQSMEVLTRKRGDGRMKLSDSDLEKKKNAGYAWKIARGCYCPAVGTRCATAASMTGSLNSHLNVRSQSCPFCRGSLKRVSSRDLWVFISNSNVIDTISLAKENLRHFYLYIESLPLVMPDTHLVIYDYLL